MNGGKEEETEKCKRAREHLLLLTVSSTRTTMYGRGSEASLFHAITIQMRPENSVGPSVEKKKHWRADPTSNDYFILFIFLLVKLTFVITYLTSYCIIIIHSHVSGGPPDDWRTYFLLSLALPVQSVT